MLAYPIQVSMLNNAYEVKCFDIPEVVGIGENEMSAIAQASKSLENVIEDYFNNRKQIPLPDVQSTYIKTIELSSTATVKILLMNEMVKQGVYKVDLARKMKLFMPQVNQLLNLRYASRLDYLEEVCKQLGKRMHISIV